MFVNVGFPSTSFGIYQPYIVAVPGMTHAYGSLIVTLRNLSSLLTMFFVAIYYKKFNCRMGIVIATIITAIGFVLFGFSDNVVMFSISSVICGIGYGLGGSAGMTILLGNWFTKDIGKAIGIATIGSSLSGVILPGLVLYIISNLSLNYAFWAQACIAIVTAVILLIFVRNKPLTLKTNSENFRKKTKIMSKHKYRLFVFGIFLIGGACLSGIVYLSILFTTAGVDANVAANVVAVCSAFLCLGKFITGYTFDRFGTYKGTALVIIIVFSGILLLCWAPYQSDIFAYVAAALFGWGSSITTVGISKWSLDLSRSGRREKTVRDFQSAYAAGGFVTGMFPGLIAEVFNSYIPFYAFSVFLIIIAGIIILSVYPRK